MLFLVSLVAFALYCRRKSHSFIGTGRVTDIEAWSLKAAISWVATTCITLLVIIEVI